MKCFDSYLDVPQCRLALLFSCFVPEKHVYRKCIVRRKSDEYSEWKCLSLRSCAEHFFCGVEVV